MTTTKAAAVLLAALALAEAPAVARPSAGVSVGATVPVSCNVSVVDYTVVTLTPNLIVNVRVHQNCNATHRLTVSYKPKNLTNPDLLFVRLDGQNPDATSPGIVTFLNLPHTNAIKPLRIVYAGGPRLERLALAQAFVIGVSAP
jgi:hypothetical protein